ncbi:unnamed protein product [Peronospora destructor]|uniref:Uncharacterized protein n=1 Tax=Peronospora destructor TaxID=86335 RepID=A0AAV0U436_9STRA|nr:unnamed protein product [Peronospora destructor]
MTMTSGVTDTRCDSMITEKPISSDKPGFEFDHDFDAIRAEYQQCVTECEEVEVHIARLSNEMAQLEEQLRPVELTMERP